MYDRHRPCDACGIDDDLAFGAARDRLCFDCAPGPDGRGPQPDCGAVYTTNVLGGQDVCVREPGHAGRHDRYR